MSLLRFTGYDNEANDGLVEDIARSEKLLWKAGAGTGDTRSISNESIMDRRDSNDSYRFINRESPMDTFVALLTSNRATSLGFILTVAINISLISSRMGVKVDSQAHNLLRLHARFLGLLSPLLFGGVDTEQL